MSILQEYQRIRNQIGEEKFQAIEKYLKDNPELFLSDIYYKEEIWKKFDEWYKGRELKMKREEWLSQHKTILQAHDWMHEYDKKCEKYGLEYPEYELKWNQSLWEVYRIWFE